MKRVIVLLLTGQFMVILSHKLYSQSNSDMQELGITTGGFTNFPANQDYLTKSMSAFYIAPYVRIGQHEFSAGFLFPLQTEPLFINEDNIAPRLGAIAGYKFYVFNVYGRENLFIHYSFQYIRFSGSYDSYSGVSQYDPWTVGLNYTLDYVISQAGYKVGSQYYSGNIWNTEYIWNNLSTHVGLIFKLTSLKKKDKK
jgi:hypothetical protein